MAQAPKNNLTKRVDALKLKRKEKNSSAAEKDSSHSTSEVNNGTDSSEEMSEGECGDKSTTEEKTKKRQVATYQFHDDSDSEEEIFKVKRKVEGGDAENILGSTCNGESVTFEEPVIGSRNKVLSKVALAKKALKKNLQLSEHKRWDDDGEVSDIVHDTPSIYCTTSFLSLGFLSFLFPPLLRAGWGDPRFTLRAKRSLNSQLPETIWQLKYIRLIHHITCGLHAATTSVMFYIASLRRRTLCIHN